MAKRDNLNILLKTVQNNVSRSLNVAHVCSVISMSDDKKTANIQPLAQTEDGDDRAMLIDVPVTQNAKQFIEVGSIVVVLFMDRNISYYSGKPETFEIPNERSHSVNDGVVIGVL